MRQDHLALRETIETIAGYAANPELSSPQQLADTTRGLLSALQDPSAPKSAL